MRLDRRQFLKGALAAGAVVAFPRWARADGAPPAGTGTIVLLHLVGGNDGLNTVVPYAHPRYRRLRPTLAVEPATVVKVDDEVGLHPALRPLAAQLDRGQIAIVNGVGYPEPDYSHFRATEIWYTAEPRGAPTDGWIGRALEARERASPVRAIAIATEQPLSFAGSATGVVTLTDFSSLRVPRELDDTARLYREYRGLEGARADVGRAGAEALDVAGRIASLQPAAGPFAGRLGEDLRKVVALLSAGLDLEAIHLGFGGFDTHANQAGAHAGLLGQLATNLNVFQDRLDALGLSEKVVTVVFSEFGRRAEENASGGTDHGSAGPMFVLGRGVRPGLHGAYPDLDDLDGGNLRFTTDFRSVYAAVLSRALAVEPGPILGDFRPLELFR